MINENWKQVAKYEDMNGQHIFDLLEVITDNLNSDHGFSPEYVSEKIAAVQSHFDSVSKNYIKRKGNEAK